MLTTTEHVVNLEVVNDVVHLTVIETEVKLLEVAPVILMKEGSGLFREEALQGVIDGSNKTFTVSGEFETGSTWVFVNGMKQKRGRDYTEQGNNTIVFDEAPSNIELADDLEIIYRTL